MWAAREALPAVRGFPPRWRKWVLLWKLSRCFQVHPNFLIKIAPWAWCWCPILRDEDLMAGAPSGLRLSSCPCCGSPHTVGEDHPVNYCLWLSCGCPANAAALLIAPFPTGSPGPTYSTASVWFCSLLKEAEAILEMADTVGWLVVSLYLFGFKPRPRTFFPPLLLERGSDRGRGRERHTHRSTDWLPTVRACNLVYALTRNQISNLLVTGSYSNQMSHSEPLWPELFVCLKGAGWLYRILYCKFSPSLHEGALVFWVCIWNKSPDLRFFFFLIKSK